MSFLILFLTTIIALNNAVQECSSESCTFDVYSGAVLVCGCGVQNCEINVMGTSGKEITLITYAASTKLNCNDIDSCQGAEIYANINTTYLGDGLWSPGSVIVNCNDGTSCKDMNITSEDVDVTVNANGIDAFDEAELRCDGTGQCLLLCSNTETSCEGSLCKSSNNCDCRGVYCPDRTEAPSKSPIIETGRPTKSPVVEPPAPITPPDYERCEAEDIVTGVCNLSPSSGDIIVVTKNDGVTELIVDCSQLDQCKDLIVYSAAKSTKIFCGPGKTSCDSALFFIGELNPDDVPLSFDGLDFENAPFNDAIVSCTGIDSCKSVNVTVNGDFNNNPVVKADSEKAFSESVLECNLGLNDRCILLCVNDTNLEPCDQAICDGDCELDYFQPNHRVINVRQASNPLGANPSLSVHQSVIGSRGATIVLTNEYDDCIVDCSNKDQCIESNGVKTRIFTSCKNTFINCGEASCKNMLLYAGNVPSRLLPQGFNALQFTGTQESLSINCDGYGACLGSQINVIGNYEINPEINATMPNSLKDASIMCEGDSCIINCDSLNSCDKVLLSCDLLNPCECNGECFSLHPSTKMDTVITNTQSPTLQTIEPTGYPSRPPTHTPTAAPTSSELVSYTPKRDTPGVFICKNNVNVCQLDCDSDASFCDHKVILLSAANITEVFCNTADTCKGIQLYFGDEISQGLLSSLKLNTEFSARDFENEKAHGIYIGCNGKSSCYKAIISSRMSVKDKIEILTSNAVDALKDARISIKFDPRDPNPSCFMECGDEACQDTKFLNVNDCDCTGILCPRRTQTQKNYINYVPQNNMPNSKTYNNDKHYPAFLPTAIIICISFGLICLISFCLYYKYFTNKQNKIHNMLNDNIHGYNKNANNIYENNFQAKTLEMENFA